EPQLEERSGQMNARLNRKLPAALAGLALAAGVVVASAPPAMASHDRTPVGAEGEPPNFTPSGFSAVDCDWEPWSNGEGGATVKNSIYLRTGPGKTCGNASGYSIPVGTRLGGWCWTINEARSKWYFVSVGGAAPYGWIYEGNVKNVSTFDTQC
ncbi:hypothetical protein, partial [Micromonospora sp. DT62]|uniref:hypothetical protein n=1 Tax=Micromonospora sp. DT62 TaxID=3416521 RepID=UPI003CF3DEFF